LFKELRILEAPGSHVAVGANRIGASEAVANYCPKYSGQRRERALFLLGA
jgi:hypothetical protein